MGAANRKTKHSKLKKIAHLEQSYQCYENADHKTKILLRQQLIGACDEGNADEVVNLLQLGVPVDSFVTYTSVFQYSATSDATYTLFALIPEDYKYEDRISTTLRQKRLKVLDILIEYGIDINLKGSNGQTVLHKLCKVALAKDFTLFKYMIELGADINSVDNELNTLLHFCCIGEKLFNKKAILKLLLERGLDPNAQNLAGDTALHLSARCNNDTHIKLLMEHGASVNVQNKTGQLPLHEAILSNSSNCGCSLDASNAGITIRLLLTLGSDVNLANNEGLTPFATALGSNLIVPLSSNDLCQEFLNSGADINARDRSGSTILHICYKSFFVNDIERQTGTWFRAHIDAQEYIALGANVNIKNSNHFFPFDYCLHHIKIEISELQFLSKALKYHIEAGLNARDISTLNLLKLQHIYSSINRVDNSAVTEMFTLLKKYGFNFALGLFEDTEVWSLKRLCANYIRISLQPNAKVGLNKLALPLSFKNCIVNS